MKTMFAYEPIVLTLLLIMLLYTYYGVYVAMFVFTVTTVTTYICYSLKTQLRLERVVTFIMKTASSKSSKDNERTKYQGIESLPKPIGKILQKLIDSIIKDFITTWYVYIGPDEQDFIDEVKRTLEHVVVEIVEQLQHVDIHGLIVLLIRMFQRHIHLFDECRKIIVSKYPGLNDDDFTLCITELYEAGSAKHIATLNKSAEIDYVKTLLDIILYKFAPKDAFLCQGGRFMLREVLANQLVVPLIQDFSYSHVINEVIIDLLAPSLPMKIVLENWQAALHEINTQEKKIEEEEIIEDVSVEEQLNETQYESASEEKSSEPLFACQPVAEEESVDVLRFNKFDARLSAPVYGLVSARDHEKSKTKQRSENNPKLPANSPPVISSWGVCPPPDSKVFLESSFKKMPRNQDEISEQMKSKLKTIADILPSPATCSFSCNNSDDSEQSAGNVNSALYNHYNDSPPSSVGHKSGEDGMFYESAPSCPTCIEMTLLASPFRTETSCMVMNSDKKVKVSEHECGLEGPHYFYPAQMENENITLDVRDDQSFVSCTEDYQNDISDTENSSVPQSVDRYNSLSDASSSQASTSYDDIEVNQEFKSEDIDKSSFSKLKTIVENTSSKILNKKKILKSKKKRNVMFKLFKSSSFLLPKRVNGEVADGSKPTKHKRRQSLKRSATKRGSVSDDQKCETSSISTNVTRFLSIPENDSDRIESEANWLQRESLIENFVEEVALEAQEEDDMDLKVVDPLSNEIEITETQDARSVKSGPSMKSGPSVSDSKTDKPAGEVAAQIGESYIPIFEGEVMMPHPSKHPAKWLYPIQMISIPSSELAYEKGWEPGINKYTLYIIHYDIRIWPDYQTNEEEKEAKPLIREIKRRYREFLYLHNRLTHGPMAKHMKGILRPNRRYALPFGRMDPDVIEGRRKILEAYLVSLVSRPEMCNSREFKDFLGSGNPSDVALLRQKSVSKKLMYHAQMNTASTVKPSDHTAEGDSKDEGMRGCSQYFIHGYEVPRMFGYADQHDKVKHSGFYIEQYVDGLLPSSAENTTVTPLRSRRISHYATQELIQEPSYYLPTTSGHIPADEDLGSQYNLSTVSALGPRMSGDGSENPDEVTHSKEVRSVRFDDASKLNDGKKLNSINIAAKFSQKLATKLEEGNAAIAHEKDLFESSWPLTNAIISIACQVCNKYPTWLTYERVQQSVLFSLGGVIEWLIGREIDEVIMKERCYKYLCDLYRLVWNEQGTLRASKPPPDEQQRQQMKEDTLHSIMDIIPKFVMTVMGPKNFENCCEELLQTVQYPKINKEVIYVAVELILMELIPELKENYAEYVKTAQHENNAL